MAATELDMDKIVQIFREIVKRKTTYNETNLHYEYFKRAGDTIPYNAHGFASLRDLIQKKAGDLFYFEKVGNDLEFIAPKRIEGMKRVEEESERVDESTVYSEVNKGTKKVLIIKKVETDGQSIGSNKSKRVRVSNNIFFAQPQSTGVNNPYQNIRNDIKISFNFNAQKRAVDRCSTSDTMETNSLMNDKQLANGEEANSGTYSSARTKLEQMNVDKHNDDLPWCYKHWHLKITHPVSTNEIWARFFDEFDVRK